MTSLWKVAMNSILIFSYLSHNNFQRRRMHNQALTSAIVLLYHRTISYPDAFTLSPRGLEIAQSAPTEDALYRSTFSLASQRSCSLVLTKLLQPSHISPYYLNTFKLCFHISVVLAPHSHKLRISIL